MTPPHANPWLPWRTAWCLLVLAVVPVLLNVGSLYLKPLLLPAEYQGWDTAESQNARLAVFFFLAALPTVVRLFWIARQRRGEQTPPPRWYGWLPALVLALGIPGACFFALAVLLEGLGLLALLVGLGYYSAPFQNPTLVAIFGPVLITLGLVAFGAAMFWLAGWLFQRRR